LKINAKKKRLDRDVAIMMISGGAQISFHPFITIEHLVMNTLPSIHNNRASGDEYPSIHP
jgi:hypothetical protein